jgi:hypothetical protein
MQVPNATTVAIRFRLFHAVFATETAPLRSRCDGSAPGEAGSRLPEAMLTAVPVAADTSAGFGAERGRLVAAPPGASASRALPALTQ